MPTTTVAANNFIVPNATFIVELIIFFVMFGVIAVWVVPPISRAMSDRRELLRQRAQEAQEAREKTAAAEADYRKAMAEARHAASRLREQARESGASILSEAREAAHEEARGIVGEAHRQIESERREAFQTVRGDLGTAAVELATRIVGEPIEDDSRRTRLVEEFLDEVGDGTGDVKMARVS